MLGGLTPQVADDISWKLMNTSPEVQARIAREVQQIEQSRISSEQKRQAIQNLLGRVSMIAGPAAVMQGGD
jgi:hypothetical protein